MLVNGTQLGDGTVEDRCIRVYGVHGDDMLSSETARVLGRALLAAASELDRLKGNRRKTVAMMGCAPPPRSWIPLQAVLTDVLRDCWRC